eukprot:403364835
MAGLNVMQNQLNNTVGTSNHTQNNQVQNNINFQKFAKAAIQGSSSTKNQQAHQFFQPLIDSTNGARKIQPVLKQQQSSQKQSRNPSANGRQIIYKQPFSTSNQNHLLVIDQQQSMSNRTLTTQSQGRVGDGSLSSGRQIILKPQQIARNYESPTQAKQIRKSQIINNVKNSQDGGSASKIVINSLKNQLNANNAHHHQSQQQPFTSQFGLDLSDNSPQHHHQSLNQNFNSTQTNFYHPPQINNNQACNNKLSEYIKAQSQNKQLRSQPVSTTNAQLKMKKSMQPIQRVHASNQASRHTSSKRRASSKGSQQNNFIDGMPNSAVSQDAIDPKYHTNPLQFKSYQTQQNLNGPLHQSDILNQIAITSQRDFYKAAEMLQIHAQKLTKQNGQNKKKQNYTMATQSIASGGSVEPLLLSSQRHQLKIKPPKHSFNQQLKSNTMVQSPVKVNNINSQFVQSERNNGFNSQGITPTHHNNNQQFFMHTQPTLSTSQQQQAQNQFLSSITSKHSYNPQNYFQSAKLLNKQKQQHQQQQNNQMPKSRNNSNQNLLALSGAFIGSNNGVINNTLSPVLQNNWHTQFGINPQNTFAADILIASSQSAKNLNKLFQQQKAQNSQNAVMFDPQDILRQAQDQVSAQGNNNHQQIQAAIIKKIQNNYQVSFTNSFNQNGQPPGSMIQSMNIQEVQQQQQNGVVQQNQQKLSQRNSPTGMGVINVFNAHRTLRQSRIDEEVSGAAEDDSLTQNSQQIIYQTIQPNSHQSRHFKKQDSSTQQLRQLNVEVDDEEDQLRIRKERRDRGKDSMLKSQDKRQPVPQEKEQLASQKIQEIEQQMTMKIDEIQESLLENNTDINQQEINSRKLETYLQALDKLINTDKSSQFSQFLLKLHKGIKNTHKDQETFNDTVRQKLLLKEQENAQLKQQLQLSQKQQIKIDKSDSNNSNSDLQQKCSQMQEDLNDMERNEQECRSQIQAMASQIDERDDQIERLEIDLDNQRRKYKELFKQSMKQTTLGGKNNIKGSVISPPPHQNFIDSEDHQALFDQLQENVNENNELKQIAKEMQEELDYGKQRENKLMFFLFILKEKGFPISEVFEGEIKDIPTTRFSTHFDDEYKQMYFAIRQERKQAKKEAKLEKLNGFGIQRDEVLAMSPLTERVFTYVDRAKIMRESVIMRVKEQFQSKHFYNGELKSNAKRRQQHQSQSMSRLSQSLRVAGDGITASIIDFDQVPYLADSNLSDSNFVPVTVKKAQEQKRPAIVPKLDLMQMPKNIDSDSSSDEEEVNSAGKPRRGPNPRQLKKIFDKYNIMTCARNLMQQEKDMKKRRKNLYYLDQQDEIALNKQKIDIKQINLNAPTENAQTNNEMKSHYQNVKNNTNHQQQFQNQYINQFIESDDFDQSNSFMSNPANLTNSIQQTSSKKSSIVILEQQCSPILKINRSNSKNNKQGASHY